MGHAIDLAEDAKADLRALHAKDRVHLIEALEKYLVDRPDVEEGRKKYLAAPGTWQLAVGEHRVWYDVSGERVTVTVVFYKGRLPTAEALAQRRTP
jgi:mRNA-degrading endonuclease RelE of RelBE toxin-antitoxin system